MTLKLVGWLMRVPHGGEQFKAVHGVSVTNEALDGPLNGTRDCIVIN